MTDRALPVLDWARLRQIPLAIASSSPVEWVAGHLDRLGLRDRFVMLSCAGPERPGKPDPEVFAW